MKLLFSLFLAAVLQLGASTAPVIEDETSLKSTIVAGVKRKAALAELNITEAELLELSDTGSSFIQSSSEESSAGSQKFSVVVITHNVHSEKTEGKITGANWYPTKLLQNGEKADFVFVTHQETVWEGDDMMDQGMKALGYTKIETTKMNAHIRGHYTTISGLYYNNDSSSLSGKRLTVRTALYSGNRIIVDYGYGKVVERILIRISDDASGTVYGDLQFMGTHMPAHEGKFWDRYGMYEKAWNEAKSWASTTNVPTPTFMAGDMNWRMAYGEWNYAFAPQTMDHVNCQSNHYLEEFKCWAQGHGEHNSFKLAIQEAPLKFQPTYKRDRNDAENCYRSATAQPGELDGDANWASTLRTKQNTFPALQANCYSDNKKKTASWTDRVVFHPFGGAGIATRYYTDFYRPSLEKSDHRMVVWAGDVSFPTKTSGGGSSYCGENQAWAWEICEHAAYKTNICNGVYGTNWRDLWCAKTCCK